jgi:hypothetical protein
VKKITALSLIITMVFISACSTDLDVTGQYKETMIVYGLLDQSQNRTAGKTKQYIKVNKAFLGEGNALSYAQIKDSVQYVNSLRVVLERYKNGSLTATYNLQPDNSIPKDPGTFYAPDQANAIYSGDIDTVAPNEISITEFKLSVKNGETGTEASGSTKLLPNGTFTDPSPSLPNSAFEIISANNNNYSRKISWLSSAGARLFQLIVRFNYVDSTTNGNINKSIDYVFPIQKTTLLNGNETMFNELRGQSFLSLIGSQLSTYAELLARVPKNFTFYLISGSDDLSTFMEINEPSTGIIQDKPKYTNINNGLGIFSARNNQQLPGSRKIGNSTKDSLACGRYTKTLRFVNRQGILQVCP